MRRRDILAVSKLHSRLSQFEAYFFVISDVVHKCCYFHFSYLLTKKLKALKVKKRSNQDAAFCEYVREFRILPLPPPAIIQRVFANLTDLSLPHRSKFNDVPRLQEFFAYAR